MGADTKQLRTRIKSVDSTLHLTKAMGLVASSKIRKALESMHNGNDYRDAFEEIIAMLSVYDECKKNGIHERARRGQNLLGSNCRRSWFGWWI